MNYCVALGGLAIKELNHYYVNREDVKKTAFFIDCDDSSLQTLPQDYQKYLVNVIPCGTAQYRTMAKKMFVLEACKGEIKSFFEPIINDQDASVKIITTSFGGFGSGFAHELITYLLGLYYLKYKRKLSITLIGLAPTCYQALMNYACVSKDMLQRFETNTKAFVNEYKIEDNNHNAHMRIMFGNDYFLNSYGFYLIPTLDLEANRSPDFIESELSIIAKIDIKKRYAK